MKTMRDPRDNDLFPRIFFASRTLEEQAGNHGKLIIYLGYAAGWERPTRCSGMPSSTRQKGPMS